MLDDGDAAVHGPGPADLWFDAVPEPKAVKNRVHLDLYVPDVAALVDLGATVLADARRTGRCSATRRATSSARSRRGAGWRGRGRPFAICVDSADPVPLAAWWQARLGGDDRPRLRRPSPLAPRRPRPRATSSSSSYRSTTSASRRTAATGTSPPTTSRGLVAAGATVVRQQDDEIELDRARRPPGQRVLRVHGLSAPYTIRFHGRSGEVPALRCRDGRRSAQGQGLPARVPVRRLLVATPVVDRPRRQPRRAGEIVLDSGAGTVCRTLSVLRDGRLRPAAT